MTTLREAAQQALDLLYRSREHFSAHTEGDWFQLERDCHSAITALRAALAEPVQEPSKRKLVPTEPTIGMCIAGDEARQNVDDLTRTPAIYRAMIAAAPASPQQAEPLTEEEIKTLPERFPSHETAAALPLIRAVERAHGIGSKT